MSSSRQHRQSRCAGGVVPWSGGKDHSMWLRIYPLWSCLVAISQRSRLCPCSPAVWKAPHGSAVHLPVPPTVMLRALAVASGPVHAQRELGKPKGIQARVDVYGANNWCPRSATFYQSTRTSAQAHVPMCTDIKKKEEELTDSAFQISSDHF